VPQEPPVSSSKIIADFLHLLGQHVAAPKISASPILTTLPILDAARPCALLLSPHPDDECLTGVLPLRLRREQNWQIVNLAVTLGSNLDRRAERKDELAKACAVLDFECALPVDDGFSNVSAATRNADPAAWRKMVVRLSEIIAQLRPQALFMPHAGDWNATHIGVHLLGLDALANMPSDFSCAVVMTEYWQPMDDPNVMIGIGENDVATLLSALACHVGEVARNPYDRRFPAYLIDNVRRGSEILGGKGAEAMPMDFAEMYKVGLWLKGKFVPSALKRFMSTNENIGALFE
jgi:LmbE family N-acetylglucosaminyl deacetylase